MKKELRNTHLRGISTVASSAIGAALDIDAVLSQSLPKAITSVAFYALAAGLTAYSYRRSIRNLSSTGDENNRPPAEPVRRRIVKGEVLKSEFL